MSTKSPVDTDTLFDALSGSTVSDFASKMLHGLAYTRTHSRKCACSIGHFASSTKARLSMDTSGGSRIDEPGMIGGGSSTFAKAFASVIPASRKVSDDVSIWRSTQKAKGPTSFVSVQTMAKSARTRSIREVQSSRKGLQSVEKSEWSSL